MLTLRNLFIIAPLLLSGTVVAGVTEIVDGREIRVIDGDTVQLSSGERIRLLGIDTPEIFSPNCDVEFRKGMEAKWRLQELLDKPEVEVRRFGEDHYGRTLGLLDTVDIHLLREGLALKWETGRYAKQQRIEHWCGSSD